VCLRASPQPGQPGGQALVQREQPAGFPQRRVTAHGQGERLARAADPGVRDQQRAAVFSCLPGRVPDQRRADALATPVRRDEEKAERIRLVLAHGQFKHVASGRAVVIHGQPGLHRIPGEAMGPPAEELPKTHRREVRFVGRLAGDQHRVAGLYPLIVSRGVEPLDAHACQLTWLGARRATELGAIWQP